MENIGQSLQSSDLETSQGLDKEGSRAFGAYTASSCGAPWVRNYSNPLNHHVARRY